MMFGDDLLGVFEDFLDAHLDKTVVDDEKERTFSVRRYERSGNTIEGVFIGGSYGRGADHYNIEQGTRDRGAQGPDDSVETPYYFLLHLPENDPTRALFLLEMIGSGSVKGPFDEIFQDFLRDIDDTTMFNISKVVSKDLIEQVEGADRVLSLKMEKERRAAELYKRVGKIFQGDGPSAKEKLEIKATTGKSIPLDINGLREIVDNKETKSYEIMDEEYDDAKLSIRVDDSTRTLSIFEEDVRMEQIIEPEKDGVERDEQMNPVPASLSPIARNFASDILRRHGEEPLPEATIL